MAYYAWSPIRHGGEVKDGLVVNVQTVAYGDSVSQKDLGVSDEDWQAMVEGGSVREVKPPELPEGYTGSPIQFMMEQARQAAEGGDVVAMSSGASAPYFGPSNEEVLADPTLVTGEEKKASESDKAK